jgi:iron complex outermembrane receptor protein
MKKLIYIGLSVIASTANANFSIAEELEEVVVTSALIDSQIETSKSIHILSGESLSSDATNSIGSLIDGLTGVSSSDFGTAVGQPVIRGLSGSRVKLLNNGKVVRDISSLGPDHSNEIDLGLLEQIEIVKGPSSLLYANGAVGGIVNIVDNSIAKQDIESFKFNLGAGYEDGNEGNTGSASFVGNVGGINIASSVQYSDLGNYAIPEGAVTDDHGHEGEEHNHEANTLKNSDFTKTGYKLGLSKVEDWGYVGLSYADSSSTYGIPFHGEHHEHCEETPTPTDCITDAEGDLVQVLLEADGHCTEHPDECISDANGNLFEPVKEEEERIFANTNSETINFEGSYKFYDGLVKQADYYIRSTSYEHTEQHAEEHHDHEGEQEGEQEEEQEEDHEEHELTLFKNNSNEFGLTMDMSSDTYLQKLNLNITQEEVSIDGEEKFLEATKSDEMTLGYFKSTDFGQGHIDFGLRVDQIERTSINGNYDDTLTSVSTTISPNISGKFEVSLGLSSVQKAPSAMELFVTGDHLAVQRYEIGNPDMATEKANNIDLNLEMAFAGFDAKLNLFRNNISNYIYAEESDDVASIQARLDALGKNYSKVGNDLDLDALTELEVALFTQKDAIFEGYELELSRSIALKSGNLDVSLSRDNVDAKFKDGDYIPRTVPTRNILNLNYKANNGLNLFVSIKDVQMQSKVAMHDDDDEGEEESQEEHHDHGETPTDGFQWVNLSLSKDFKTSDTESLRVSFFAKNLLNKVARNHTSFVKDEVPLPGRNLGLKVNYNF